MNNGDHPVVWSIGATSRIAIEMQRCWAKEGYRFVLVGRNQDKLNRVADDLLACGATAVDTRVSLQPPDKPTGFDLLLISVGSLSDQDRWQVDRMYRESEWTTNTSLIINWIEWGAMCVEYGEGGKIAVISSVASDRAKKSNYGYGASKAALDFYLKGVDHRLAKAGGVVVILKPGPTNTPMTAGIVNRKLADPSTVGLNFCQALRNGSLVVYSPKIWRYIMSIIRLCPRKIWNMTNF